MQYTSVSYGLLVICYKEIGGALDKYILVSLNSMVLIYSNANRTVSNLKILTSLETEI